MPKKLKHGEIARVAGVLGESRQRVNRWHKQGKMDDFIRAGVCDADGFSEKMADLFSPQHVKAAESRWHGEKEAPSPKEMKQTIKTAGMKTGMTHAEAMRIKANYDAALKKLEYERQSGKLLDAEEVKRQASECAGIFQHSLLSMPDRFAAVLAAAFGPETATGEVKQVIKDEVNVILQATKEALGEAIRD